ncbi:MAG: hypothetical protein A3A97_02040 [Candidatus Terrybacteria bacterium RIFCSPLOWO2_01_FULL_40_23]|uniref:Uncharacterized protein n=1 Tax=Candidatus Terrybacteria bacterium RIFCSPLOWO2_01_FULL_40_23 TaxID=1802366 RepID=A0A1G2PSW5_9BACT|nr:MAG: hypothetical protein A3A97_02040 [Candidatus Terrybacteria bacterium RIFCSPLOWO2_01_FULL_40_23]
MSEIEPRHVNYFDKQSNLLYKMHEIQRAVNNYIIRSTEVRNEHSLSYGAQIKQLTGMSKKGAQ